MKDIGSIFPLYDSDFAGLETELEVNSEGVVNYSLCRETFAVIAKHLKDTNRRVLIPAYTCDTVITPFKEQGWDCYYYPIDNKLKIDTDAVLTIVEALNQFEIKI